MPKYKKTSSREVEEESRRKKSLGQEEGKVMESPSGEMAPPSPMAGDPIALLTSPQMAHPANAPLRAQATKELQRQRGNIYVQRLIRSGAIQAKLTVNPPDDAHEREADRVAEEVLRMPEPQVQRQPEEEEEELLQPKPLPGQITPLVQRQVEEEEEEEEEELLCTKEGPGHTSEAPTHLEDRINAIKRGGQPLPESVRNFFEPRFGYDFSQVRVHTGAQAAEAARAVDAQAFTVGQDIVFGAGHYAPETTAGKKLLAHELTHVVQQQSSINSPTLQLKVGGDVTRMSITYKFAEDLTDEELKQQISLVRAQLDALDPSDPRYETAHSNLDILIEERSRRDQLKLAKEKKSNELKDWYHKVYEVADKNSDHYKEAWMLLLVDLIKVPEGLSTLNDHIVTASLGGLDITGTIVRLPMKAGILLGSVTTGASLIWNGISQVIDKAKRIENLENQKEELRTLISKIFEQRGTDCFLKIYGAEDAKKEIEKAIENARSQDEVNEIRMPEIPSEIPRERIIAVVYQAWLVEKTSIEVTVKYFEGLITMAWATLKAQGVPDYIIAHVIKHAEKEVGREKLFSREFAVKYYINLCKKSFIFFEDIVTYEDITLSKEKPATCWGVPCKVKATNLIKFPAPEYGLAHEYPGARKAEVQIPTYVEIIWNGGGKIKHLLIEKKIKEIQPRL
jgi:flagellar basal body-associated protein FliL